MQFLSTVWNKIVPDTEIIKVNKTEGSQSPIEKVPTPRTPNRNPSMIVVKGFSLIIHCQSEGIADKGYETGVA
jgi:hypothetical protein